MMKGESYIRRMPATWWFRNSPITIFTIRELTSLFVAGYAVLLLVLLYRYGQGREQFHQFFEALKSPTSLTLHVIIFSFVVFHTATWFNLTPKVVILWRGEKKVSPILIIGAHYALWLLVSVAVLAVALK
jgi:succinate dehydrogenase subunit C